MVFERERPQDLATPLQLRKVAWASRLLLSIVVLHGVFATVAFDRLPERLPVHFSVDGAADGFAHPGLSSWFFLVLVSIGAAILIGAVSLSLFRIPPKWVNLPQKAAFLSLPEIERLRVLGTVSAFTLLLGATLCAGLFSIHVIQALAAFGVLGRFPVVVPFVIMGILFAELIAMTVCTSAAVDSAVSRRIKKGR